MTTSATTLFAALNVLDPINPAIELAIEFVTNTAAAVEDQST